MSKTGLWISAAVLGVIAFVAWNPIAFGAAIGIAAAALVVSIADKNPPAKH